MWRVLKLDSNYEGREALNKRGNNKKQLKNRKWISELNKQKEKADSKTYFLNKIKIRKLQNRVELSIINNSKYVIINWRKKKRRYKK